MNISDKVRFPEKVFCWGDYVTGPFKTYKKCAEEYQRARAEGNEYVPPPGIKRVTIKEYDESKLPNRESTPLNVVAQNCRLCIIFHETCPVCYAAWWKTKHPSIELNESHEFTYAKGNYITIEIDDYTVLRAK